MSSLVYKGKRVVVLGATGFIGRWVARALTSQGAELVLPVRDCIAGQRVADDYQVKGMFQQMDLRDVPALRKLFSEFRPAVTFNLAGYGVDPEERDEQAAFEINTALVNTLCEMQLEYGEPGWFGQHLIHAGSALEYGTASGDLSEESDEQPTTLYGRSKLAGTNSIKNFCREEKLRALTARLFTVYGPGEHDGRLLPSLMKAAECGSTLDLTAGLQQRDFTFVSDVADGLLRLGLLTHESKGESVNLATGQLTSVREFAETAASILGLRPETLRFGNLPSRPEEMHHAPVNLNRLRELTSWHPDISIPEGIRRTIEFDHMQSSLNRQPVQTDIVLQHH